MLLKALLGGFRRSLSNKRAVLWLFLAVWIPGALATLPLGSALEQAFARSVAAAELSTEGLTTDLLVDLAINHEERFAVALTPLMPLLALGWWLGFFLSGGVFSTVSRPDGYDGTAFWSGAVACFPRYLRLLLWSLVPLVLIGVLSRVPGWWVSRAAGGDPGRDVESLASLISWLILGCGLLYLRTALDLARAAIARRRERATRRVLWRSLQLAVRRLPTVMGYAVLMLGLAAAVGWVFLTIRQGLPIDQEGAVLVAAALGQVYLLWRAWWRVARYAGSSLLDEHYVEGSTGRYPADLPPTLAEPISPLLLVEPELPGQSEALADLSEEE